MYEDSRGTKGPGETQPSRSVLPGNKQDKTESIDGKKWCLIQKFQRRQHQPTAICPEVACSTELH
ncbi:hypothetical protein EYF80_018502 [Liparis tanakae]|uniref:Uncharacterized protein n=1 Tax=Liparis tanakae TaxID=230148 RepID=A0A4Z2I0I1_9TELE|nr:hypothetical protein EYF80_018502 [Liparis tanakae]